MGRRLQLTLLLQLLAAKLNLSVFCVTTWLLGSVLAPALFFGAVAAAAYHDVVAALVPSMQAALTTAPALAPDVTTCLTQFLSVAEAPAYATLGAIFGAP